MPEYMEDNVAEALFGIISTGLTSGRFSEKYNVLTLFRHMNGSVEKNKVIQPRLRSFYMVTSFGIMVFY